MNCRVSVVVATFNRGALLQRLLGSLARQDADSENYETVVVVDGSADNTMEVLGQAGKTMRNLRWLVQPNRGPAAARNLGFRAGRGSIIAFIDDDCIAAGNWITAILNAFSKNDFAGVEGVVETGGGQSRPMTHVISSVSPGRYLTCNIAYRREILERVNGFDEGFGSPINEDQDLGLRAAHEGTIGFSREMRVIHPPVPMRFWAECKRCGRFMADYVRGERLLFQKHPREYGKIRHHSSAENTLRRNSLTYAWTVLKPFLKTMPRYPLAFMEHAFIACVRQGLILYYYIRRTTDNA